MKTIPAAARAHLDGESTTLAYCWRVEKKDGSMILGTDHDVDVAVTVGEHAGVYLAGSNITASDNRSTATSSVDNMEVVGAFQRQNTTLDVSIADIESGNLDNVPVTLFVCNWQAPDDWQIIARYGYLGEISRDSDGKYNTELRGLKQILTQVFLRTYSTKCQVKRFCDSECTLDILDFTYGATVTAVTNRRRFDISFGAGSPSPFATAFRGGELVFVTGDNAGFLREVKLDDVDGVLGHISLWENFPENIQIGDTLTIARGCDRLDSTCKAYGNILNFRGYGIFIEGNDALTKGPT